MLIPGAQPVPGRRFLYVEGTGQEDFLATFRAIGDFIEAQGSPYPEGGMISENTKLVTRNGAVFFGVSFKGDLGRWESGVREFCKEHLRRVGEVTGAVFTPGEGPSVPLEECTVEQY